MKVITLQLQLDCDKYKSLKIERLLHIYPFAYISRINIQSLIITRVCYNYIIPSLVLLLSAKHAFYTVCHAPSQIFKFLK